MARDQTEITKRTEEIAVKLDRIVAYIAVTAVGTLGSLLVIIITKVISN